MKETFENLFMSGMVRLTSGILSEDSDSEVLVPSAWSTSDIKRSFDLGVALVMLAVLSIPIIVIGAALWITSREDVFFVQERRGKGGRPFRIIKFRTMVANPKFDAVCLTRKGDCRITAIGRFLRRFKLDELPQLFNVVRGDMSIVGPRPKVAKYAGMDQLACRPGLTGAATLAFRGEEEILSGFADPLEMDSFYFQYIMPTKAHLDASYMQIATLWSDIGLLCETAKACIGLKPESSLLCSLKRVEAERLMVKTAIKNISPPVYIPKRSPVLVD